MENPVLIFGTGAMGLQAYDIFKRNNVLVYGFLDDDKSLHGTEIDEATVLGDTDDGGFLKLIGSKCEAFVAIGERKVRKQLTDMLNERRKVMPVNAIHDTASLSALSVIGHGNLIGASVVLGPKSLIGNHCIIETGAIIEAMVTIGDYSTLAPGCVVNSRVTVGENAYIGAGSVLVAGVTIGKNARVGAGSIVVDNVPDGATYFGNPAKAI